MMPFCGVIPLFVGIFRMRGLKIYNWILIKYWIFIEYVLYFHISKNPYIIIFNESFFYLTSNTQKSCERTGI